MIASLDDVESETRTIGPLVLTTPVLRQLGLAEIIDRFCPVAEQADMGHGVVAEMVVQCRMTEPLGLYDMVDWAERYGMAALYNVLERAEQLNDDRIGRMLDVVHDRHAVILGELVGRAAWAYELDLSRLHADTAPIKFAGLFADQPDEELVRNDQPEAPLELSYTVDREQASRDAELDSVYLLVARGPATRWDDATLLQEWKGRYKVEHCFRLTNQLFLVGPVFLKTPRRIASLILLIMIGCLVAGLIERQMRRALAERQEPIHGLMPEGRDNLRPTIPRILKAFAHYSIVHIRRSDGTMVGRRFAKLNAVQEQILDVLRFPCPDEVFG